MSIVTLAALRRMTALIPPIPHASGLSNRIVKPLYLTISRDPVELPVWNGLRMKLDPADALGGYLCFIPHLYDRWERGVIENHLRHDMTFVDLGANIGAYSLWASQFLSAEGGLVAIEASPSVFRTLEHNLRLNTIRAPWKAICKGVSDKQETLSFAQNIHGNAGGSGFLPESKGSAIPLECDTLLSVLLSNGIDRMNFLKVDIEGFELRVLRRFFQDVRGLPALKPEFVLVEIFEGPLRAAHANTAALLGVLDSAGYVTVEHHGNSLFRLRPDKSAR